jgi:hypothetical protein
MKFKEPLNLVGKDPLFESSLLLAGDIKPEYVKVQLTLWEKAGRIIQLRRGRTLSHHLTKKPARIPL